MIKRTSSLPIESCLIRHKCSHPQILLLKRLTLKFCHLLFLMSFQIQTYLFFSGGTKKEIFAESPDCSFFFIKAGAVKSQTIKNIKHHKGSTYDSILKGLLDV